MRKTGDSPWNAACMEGDEALDEECRQDPQQLPVEDGGKRDGVLHSAHLHQADAAGGLQMEELLSSREMCPHDERAGQRLPAL